MVSGPSGIQMKNDYFWLFSLGTPLVLTVVIILYEVLR